MPIPGQLTTTPITTTATGTTTTTTLDKSLALGVVSQDTSLGCVPTRSQMHRAPMRQTKVKAVEHHQGTQLPATSPTMARVV